MLRPINWVVFGLSLLVLYANLTFGRKPPPPEVHLAAAPLVSQLNFSRVVVEEPTPPQFGYIRDDGSFVPLRDADALTSTSPSWQ